MKASRGQSAVSIVLIMITVISLALEARVFWLRKRNMPDYEKVTFSVQDCTNYEFQETGREDGEYEALAYNSYFACEILNFGAADTITVYMSKASGDASETVIYAYGVLEGIRGEFVYPLQYQSEGVYLANLNMDTLEAVRIYPTEKVHSFITFSGFTVNEQTRTISFSFGEWMVLWLGLALILTIYVQIKAAIRKTDNLSPWITVMFGMGFLASIAGLMASRMFTAASTLGDVLPIVGGVLGVAMVIVLYIVTKIRSFTTRMTVLAAILVVLFVFANAPLQAPDENIHFMRAWTISEGHFDFDNNYVFPQEVYLLANIFEGEFHNRIIKTGNGNALTKIQEFMARRNGEMGELKRFETHLQVLRPYLLPGAAMAVGRIFTRNVLFLMYIGRLANAAMYVFAFNFAMRKAKRYRFALLLAGFWPLTLFMCGSFSYDAIYLSSFLVFLGLVLGDMEGKHDFWWCVISFGLLISIKPTSIVLLLMLFLLPKEKRSWKLAVACVAFGYGLYFGSDIYVRFASKGMSAEPVLPGVDIQAQIKYILSNPFRYLAILLVDGYQNAFYIGRNGQFGWLDVDTILTPILTVLALFIVSLLGTKATLKDRRKWENLLLGFLSIVFYGIVITGFYCACSTLGSSSILGVQARYLIPMIPCLSIMMANGWNMLKVSVVTEETYNEFISLWICSGTALVAAAELFLNNFLM
ncbi:MAG: DUF2142 domain-containing protein [Oscillospiraceae bacterium]|nr:DUF2142 domain-containing protein [Oscillospiraceae bacterium]